MTQENLYDWIADQNCSTQPDTEETQQFVEETVERMEKGSWKTLKSSLEIEK